MSKKTKKPQFEPILIHSREGFQATLTDWNAAKLEAQAINVEIEQAVSALLAQRQKLHDDLNRKIMATEAAMHVYLRQHPEELGDKKSIDFTLATVGFRLGKHKVDKTGSKDTWETVLARLQQVVLQKGENVTFDGETYVRYKAEIDKEQLIADRDLIPAEVWDLIGARITQEEFFYIDPKSEVLKSTKAVAQEAA